MSSEQELFAKLDRWLADQPAVPTIFEVVRAGDVELLAAFILRHFRVATKRAVADRLEREASNLNQATWERAGAIGALIDWLAHTWNLSVTEQLNLFALSGEDDLGAVRNQLPQHASHEHLDRLAMLIDIYQALRCLLPGRENDDGWLRRPNAEPLFGGKSPISIMLERGRLGIRDVRAYLWEQIWSV